VLFGAPDVDAKAVMAEMREHRAALAEGLRDPRMLVRADLPQARGYDHGVQAVAGVQRSAR
jgi:hypothetical protein